MKEKIVKNLSYIFCSALGVFTFILFAFPYLKIKMREGIFTTIGGKANGYSIMAMFDYGFAGVMSAILQILVLLIAVLMLVYGIIGVVSTLIKDKESPIKIGKIGAQTISKISMLIYSALNALILIFLIVVCAEYNKVFVNNANIKMLPSVGVYFGMFVPIIGYFILAVLGKKKPDQKDEKKAGNIKEDAEEEFENEEGLTLDDVIPTAQNLKR